MEIDQVTEGGDLSWNTDGLFKGFIKHVAKTTFVVILE